MSSSRSAPRYQISGAFSPPFSRNQQTGKLESASAKTNAAVMTIHHDRNHPSRLVVPVIVQPKRLLHNAGGRPYTLHQGDRAGPKGPAYNILVAFGSTGNG